MAIEAGIETQRTHPGHDRLFSARIPLATYRLQFTPAFTFADAARVVSYLHALGITDCYASPYFKARPGSPHGYDIIDHNALRPEVGDQETYNAFVDALQHHGMGHLLDIVPNHMGIAESSNPLWTDVLENGPSSLYAAFFDIDWAPVKTELANKVLLPILGEQYGRVLENQELQVQYEDGAFFLQYWDHRLPIAPRPSVMMLRHRLDALAQTLGPDHPQVLELQSIITALHHLPLRTETEREKVIERHREKEIIKKRLATLTTTSAEVRAFLSENVRLVNGVKGDPRSFDLLDTLLDDQAYRLSYWRVAAEEINYRRFFDINELAAIRTEDPAVFAATHQLTLQLLAHGKVTGLRVDHVDGLYDPAAYLRRLQQATGLALRSGVWPPTQSTEENESGTALACYIVVEKILAEGERLPEHWLIHGTTGYDFLADLNGIFVDPENAQSFDELYARFIRERIDFSDLVYESKKLIMQVSLSSEINVLAHELDRLSEKHRHSRDFTLNSLTLALREIIACFPVYRTYINGADVSDGDRTIIETAVARAKRKNPATDVSIFNFVRDTLLLRFPETAGEDGHHAQRAFAMKLQQYSGPVMAKGVEDTAFYIYNRLVSLNEVGGRPEQFGIPLATFHAHNADRLRRWPHALLATTTHDTKRSEDVRARINVLAEIPQAWRAALKQWSKANKKKKPLVDGQPVPNRNEEYLLYQTLLGVWPFTPLAAETYSVFTQRIQDYMRKATKEAKVNTSWVNPNHAYDDALQEFVSTVLDSFLGSEDFHALRRKVAQYGMYNALAQTLLKLTVPGVPDMYQGNEMWDFSLVDPDNRRPVDYAQRQTLLSALQQRMQKDAPHLVALAREVLEGREDGRIKLYVTHRALLYRREHSNLFLAGDYLPLAGSGRAGTQVCAFARRYEQQQIIVVVPRFLTRVIPDPQVLPVGPQVWEDSRVMLPNTSASQYRNVFTGEVVTAGEHEGKRMLALGDVFAHFPVALLERI